MVIPQLSKLMPGVRFPLPAPWSMASTHSKTITNNLIELLQKYTQTYRATITRGRYAVLSEAGVTDVTLDAELIREPLIEHIGQLPVIASYLHQYLEHRDSVNLGRVLTMLSVHDIGETKTGDVVAYHKTSNHEQVESAVTQSLLPAYLFDYFEEIERHETLDGKFAKSVDAIAPLLNDLSLPPELVFQRLALYHFGIKEIIAKKQPLFAWDATLAEVFAYAIEKYRDMEKEVND